MHRPGSLLTRHATRESPRARTPRPSSIRPSVRSAPYRGVRRRPTWALAPLFLLVLLSGCASTGYRTTGDPLEPFNRKMFVFNDHLDRWILQPVSRAYVKVAPERVRASVTDFFDNLEYPNTILNQFLQGRFQRGFEDTARFLADTVVGVGGLFDPATRLGLPYHDEDLGQTLAVWGVGRGPYLVLPFIGPDTLRNLPNLAVGALSNPLFYVSDAAITIPLGAAKLINERANVATQIEMVRQSLDPYIFMREAYLQHRRFLIYNGHPPVELFNGAGPGKLAPAPVRRSHAQHP